MAFWIQATGVAGSRSNQAFEVLLATDGNTYIDGELVTVTIASP